MERAGRVRPNPRRRRRVGAPMGTSNFAAFDRIDFDAPWARRLSGAVAVVAAFAACVAGGSRPVHQRRGPVSRSAIPVDSGSPAVGDRTTLVRCHSDPAGRRPTTGRRRECSMVRRVHLATRRPRRVAVASRGRIPVALLRDDRARGPNDGFRRLLRRLRGRGAPRRGRRPAAIRCLCVRCVLRRTLRGSDRGGAAPPPRRPSGHPGGGMNFGLSGEHRPV